ncbi:hypothetical protein Hypma_007080 [Hypsizygus marmoreus]|uniref:C3H1-type domain-containing protein n=1 Tax=Hypsizygus marmoreus TaxID=39966 RepID=A0A369KEN2_HYPMA|nr:hypothetical protein Hypma_007080 [Hypsizygus marmoreus]
MAPKGHCHQFSETGSCTYGVRCKFSHTPGGGSANTSSSNQVRSRRPRGGQSTSKRHLVEFFDNYSLFTYDPTDSATSEFYRMCDLYDWDEEEKGDAKENFRDALVQQFNATYGTDENDLDSWHTLCTVLDITPLPEDLDACREAVRGTYVNLVDLVDQRHIELFSDEQALSEYTKEEGKFFPKENAKAGGLLRYLLRQILNPSTRTKRRRQRKPRLNTIIPLGEFFACFPEYLYEPRNPAIHEFRRVFKFFGWKDADRAEVRERFKDALVQEFSFIYGTDVNDPKAWHALCHVSNIFPIPESLRDCRKRVKETHVNIVDLIDAPNSETSPTMLSSEKELSDYTKATQK